jgi:ABC-2 type transport system permease protein
MLVRNKQALFWSLAFPLMFTVIFGFFFGEGSNATGTVALVNDSQTEIAKNIRDFLIDSEQINIKLEDDLNDARDQLKDNKVSSVIYIPDKFGQMGTNGVTGQKKIQVFTSPANAQANGIIIGTIEGYLTELNYKIQNASKVFTIDVVETTEGDIDYFDFVVIGLIGLALMNASIQGIAISMAKYREDKILKRITTTPLKTPVFILAEVFSRLFQNVLQVILILSISIYIFDAHIENIAQVFALALLGAILFQSIGFAIASFSKTTNAAQGASRAITIPMMFLAGVFFPIDQLPGWLSPIVELLPLAPLLEMIRQIGLDNINPFDDPTNVSIVVSWIIVMLVVSSYKFRLSEE